jgi:DNA gyrase/topoisomerase IV subunit A
MGLGKWPALNFLQASKVKPTAPNLQEIFQTWVEPFSFLSRNRNLAATETK